MTRLGVLILTLFISISLSYGGVFFDQADSFFGEYVSAGKVDYSAIKQNPEKLNALVSEIASFQIDQKDASEIKAFYINAYNILVIKGIIASYPTNSPLDKDGFFDKIKYSIAGEKLTLNEIENKKLRAEFNDPRIHFVLVCAALGCPKLIPEAYFPKSLDDQIQQRAIISLNDPDFIKVSQNQIEISEIFKWYAEDFGGKDNYRKFINTYRKDDLAENASIGFYEYDWSLNEKK